MNTCQENHSYSQYKEMLSTLNAREAQVVIGRFGIGDMEPQTLEQIGTVMGVTRERIRQIESKALRKLRQRAASLEIKLEDYL